ncbi:MAG: type II/IV secretion system protein [Verrucomicrobiaceae bacterium]|nr:type II/IV secretion system protein [Verrucomicrobiaceae bacterium]
MLDPDNKGATGKSQPEGIIPARDLSRMPVEAEPGEVTASQTSSPSAEPLPIEQLARRSGLLPVKLPRSACPVDAEGMLRKLGGQPRGDEPWMPVATLGPLLILGHYNPSSRDTWGIPDFLCVRVVIEKDVYLDISSDLRARMNYKPLSSSGALEGLAEPLPNSTPHSILDWFVCNYPLSESEKEKWEVLVSENQTIDIQRPSDYKGLPRHYGIAFVYMLTRQACFNPDEAPSQTKFPDQLLEKHEVFPMFEGDGVLYLLSESPSVHAFEDEWLSGGHESIEIVPVLADGDAIRAAIARNRGKGVSNQAAVEVGELYYSEDQSLIEIDPADMAAVNPANPSTAAEDVLKWILYRAITSRGSDLHVEKYFNTARFRARIDGGLKVIHSCSEEQLPRFIALFKNYSNMGHQHQDLQDARFGLKIGQKRIDVRVSAVPCRKENQKLTMRFLDKQDGIKELSELNLSERQLGIVNSSMKRDQGLVLVTGPTGSGKTTTLYAFINSINEVDLNIHTIEDPIEYEIEGINQTQTDEFHGINFATGLRALLRADPDVILVGESRDEETATAAINSALTGHLVLTTLHANDSLRAVSRLVSMGVEPYLLADALALSQAQRLVKRLCNYCKRPVPAPRKLQEYFYHNGIITAPMEEPIFDAHGCDECNGNGYLGRVALMEMCPVGPILAEMISSSTPMSEMRKEAAKAGVLSLYQEGMLQVVAGNTTMDEITKLAHFGVMQ